MSRIMSVARFRVHPGKLGEFKALAAECAALVRERDPGTSLYEWFCNEERSECIAIDSYSSSDAVIAHIRNVGPTMRRLRQLADVSVDLLGSPSAELMQTLQFKADGVFSFMEGLAPSAASSRR